MIMHTHTHNSWNKTENGAAAAAQKKIYEKITHNKLSILCNSIIISAVYEL